MAILYQDDKIICDEDGVTIRGYYFPLGTSKRIHYGDIKKLEKYTMGINSGKYRYWGGTPKYWLNLDWKRHNKSTAIVLRLSTQWVVPIITPDTPDEVLRILEEKTGQKATLAD